MRLNEAISKRIQEICEEKGVSVCGASLGGGKSPSAIYDLVKGRTQCSKVVTIQRFCEGAGITLAEFFETNEAKVYVSKEEIDILNKYRTLNGSIAPMFHSARIKR